MHFDTFAPTRAQQLMYEIMEYKESRAMVFRLEGAVDAERLADAVRQVVALCPPFAYRFLRVNESLQILVSPDAQAGMQILEAGDDVGGKAFLLIEGLRNRRFRVDGGPPYLFCLVRGKEVSHLVFVCHPLLLDRFSMKPLFAAISLAYAGKALPEDLGLPQSLLLETEKLRTGGPGYTESLRFWLQMLGENGFAWRPPRMEGALEDTFSSLTLDPPATQALKNLAKSLDLDLDTLLLFAFHIFLFRLTRSETVLTSFAHRIRTGSLAQVGFNENRPVFTSLLHPDMSVGGFFRQAKGLFALTRHHCDIPMREVLSELLRKNPDYRFPNVVFAEDDLPYESLALEEVKVTLLPALCHRLEVEDIALYFNVKGSLTFHVLTRFPQDAAGLKRCLAHYLSLLEHLPKNLATPLGRVPLFTAELEATARRLASGGLPAADAVDVMDAFVGLCRDFPQRPALRFGKTHLSYGEFSSTAGSIASCLAPHIKDGRQSLVGLCLYRSERMIPAIFGILGAGAGYVPLDPDMPDERLGFIVEDAGMAVVISDQKSRERIAGLVRCPVLAVEDMADAPAPLKGPGGDPKILGRIAYIIYTSGTTGKPKGVVIERGMLAHLVANLQGIWDRGPGSRWMQFASVNFDASVLEIFNPLTQGGELVVAAAEDRTDPEAVFRLLGDAGVTHAFLPPALLRLLPRRPLPQLKVIFCGGEATDEDTVRYWSKAVELANLYGPTETTVLATANTMGGFKAATHLGRPLPGYEVFLLEDNGLLSPLGGIGELCIGGPTVAREYLGRPEQTAQKFIANPFGPGRLYRTGDLGRFLPNGDLEFLGRSDFQVKVRGFRIELGDIENAIAEQPGVQGVYVGVFEMHGSKALLAWYVARNLAPEDLRRQLGERLPHYMVPTWLMPLAAFPLNISGKIDRSRLPMPGLGLTLAETLPLDELESAVQAVWAEVLHLPPASIGPESHFFHLGGHSLLAALACNRLHGTLGKDIRPRQLFEQPLFTDFCAQIRETHAVSTPLPPLVSEGRQTAPVFSRFIGMIHSRAMMLPEDNTYNIVLRVDFSREMNPSRLRRVFGELLDTHPLFRSAIVEKEKGLRLEVADILLPGIPLFDAGAEEIRARAEALRHEVLGLDRPPLWRAEVYCTQEGEVSLLFCIHHALFDGWSLNLFLDELKNRYEGHAVEPRLSWLDYCAWSRCLPESPAFAESIAYWKKKLTGVDAHTELPADFQKKKADANAALGLRFAPDLVARLKRFADAREITLPPLLFALYLVWIWRISGREDITCAYPYAGRDIAGTENILGMFVTMGFLYQAVEPRASFANLALAVHRQMLDDKEHLMATPYDAEIAGLDSLNLIFSLQSGISLEGRCGDAHYRADELPSLTSKADLTAIFYPCEDGALEGRLEYDSSLFHADTVAGYLETFKTLVASAAENPDVRVQELRYQSEADLARFLNFACAPALDLPDTSIPERFAAVAAASPAQTALVFAGKRHSYQELAEWSDALAAAILEAVPPGSRLGLSMQKSDTLVATVLAILKAGCAYVPLDPSYPPDRLRFFVENAAVSHVLADPSSQNLLSGIGLAHLHFLDPKTIGRKPLSPLPAVNPDSLAYIIHTSGSTGLPKGVMIRHATVVRLVLGSAPALDFEAKSVGALIASMNFDASVLEIFLPLLSGCTLTVISEETRKDPQALHQALEAGDISHVLLSPVVLQNLPKKALPGLKMLGFGGDVLDGSTAEWWSARAPLFSLYGPTEITVMASCGRILPGSKTRVIGRPFPGTRLYLLNPYREPVPQGAVGELCIGGDNLALGYLNREDLSLERFVLDPFGGTPYARMYLSGDLGRYLGDGSIEFFGRNDAQIKLRGFRIELGEIEKCLASFSGVQQVLCDAKGEGDNRYLAAYYLADTDLDEEDLRRHAAAFLPEYMVPAFFLRLTAFPTAASGKIDRRALPEISGKQCAHPPHAGLERQVAEVWEEILRYRGIGRDDNFFHVGGNSLLAVRMQAEVKKRLGLDFVMSRFYGAPTIEALAAGSAIDHLGQAISDARAAIAMEDPAPPRPHFQPPRRVLLTGARGFLGGYLLEVLCRKVARVDCLLRCKNVEEGMQSLKKQAAEAGYWLDQEKVRILPGDLAAPRLGLDDERWRELAAETEAIVHCGAFVHHLHSYASMKAANVEGTRMLLELALTNRQKPFTYLSTETVATSLEGVTEGAEAILPNPPVVENGYILSKWVAEQLVSRYGETFGLPVLIARPGNITGCSRSGFSNYANNHFWLFNKGCLQLGAYPDMDTYVEMTPVDRLAEAIIALALAPEVGVRVANLSNPDTLSLQAFFALLATSGLGAGAESSKDWQKRLQHLDGTNALTQIRDFYSGDLSGRPPRVHHEKTLVALQALGLDTRVEYPALISLYAGYLKSEGFLSGLCCSASEKQRG